MNYETKPLFLKVLLYFTVRFCARHTGAFVRAKLHLARVIPTDSICDHHSDEV